MVKVFEGKLESKELKIAIITARFNDFMSSKLVEGSLDALRRTGAEDKNLTIYKVPGAYEIPQMAAKLAVRGEFDGIVCLGVLIRGATPHFDYIASESAKGIAQTAMEHGIPVAFGVLTTDSLEQAIERSGSKSGNKGFEATMALIEMVNIYKELDK